MTDLVIVLGYMALMAVVGVRFSRRQTSTEAYFVAKRSVPSWAMGLSLLATLVSSVTFVAYPGSAYAKDWSLLVPGFLVVGVLCLVGTVIIPFYRQAVGMSAYEYFHKRFGRPTRVYASIAFSLSHFSKMGFVVYLLALTLNSMTGWAVEYVIVLVAAVTVFYTLAGGLEAVIWTDVIQGFVMWAGVAVCLGYLLFLPAGGPPAVLGYAAVHHKFSFGEASMDFSRPTVPVLIIYGFFWYLQRYVADQAVVQRYLVAKSDRSALKGVAFGALMAVPVWAVFMLIGTCTWGYYQITGEGLPARVAKADQVFPYFLSTHLPPGVAGFFLAAMAGSAMSMLATDLNCLAVVAVEDYYRHYHPAATDQARLRIAKWVVGLFGGLSAIVAIALAHSKGSALSMWFAVTAMLSGGLAGLFLLAFLSGRANCGGVYCGMAASFLFTVWAVLTKGTNKIIDLGPYSFPWDDLMIGAVGNVVLFVVGYAASFAFRTRSEGELAPVTLWMWLRRNRTLEVEAPVGE
jgi:SSS family solute:Na+ symporter